MTTELVYKVLSVFCGSGGQTLGLLAENPRFMGHAGRFECVAGIDNDPVACEDYERLTGSKAWCVDVMAMRRFWSIPMFWAAFGRKAPHAVVISAPCKGSSRLLSAAKAKTKPYRQLNRLAAEFLDLMLEAWGDDPPALILFENVPGFPSRAKATLRSLRSMLRMAGYKFHASTHDCGEIGGLAQHRERYLLVARHPQKCEPFLYEPPKKRVRGIGEVLSALPMPATEAAGAWGDLHTMPKISWKNWLRLGLIPAGGDWRDLAGVLEGRARREVFRRHAVADWKEPVGAITGDGGHAVGAVSDPRIGEYAPNTFQHIDRVLRPDEPTPTVTSGRAPSSGRPAVADDRIMAGARPGNWSTYGVTGWDGASGTIAGESSPSNGKFSVADPRLVPEGWHHGALGVRPWDEHAATVTSGDHPAKGRFTVADPRVDPKGLIPEKSVYDAGYGVLGWKDPARAIAGTVAAGTGAYAVADPRDLGFTENVRMMTLDEAMALELDPEKAPPFIPVIVAEDGTWHRPLTLLELAAIQSLPIRMPDGSPLVLGGTRTEIAQHVGNMIPPDAARAIGRQALLALMAHSLDGGFLGVGEVWVGPPTQRVSYEIGATA